MAWREDATIGNLRTRKLSSCEFVITVNAEVPNSITVNIQVQNFEKEDIGESRVFMAFLSDASTGLDVTGTAPNGGVAGGTDGDILSEMTADKVFLLQTELDGDVDVVLTDSGTPTFYLVCIDPADGRQTVSDAITFA